MEKISYALFPKENRDLGKEENNDFEAIERRTDTIPEKPTNKRRGNTGDIKNIFYGTAILEIQMGSRARNIIRENSEKSDKVSVDYGQMRANAYGIQSGTGADERRYRDAIKKS